MKKSKLAILIIVAMFVSMLSAQALNEDDYNRLRIIYSDAYISTMTDEEIEKALAMDIEHTHQVKNYYKGVSNFNNDSYTWTEVTEEEYENADVMPASVVYSETYKEIILSVTPVGNDYDLALKARWKAIPTVRSYDVIAMRFYNIALYDGMQTGKQIFRIKGDSDYSDVSYGPNGTNISKQKQGFGISMNIVNNPIDYLELSIDALGVVSSTNPQVWGSYQHAIRDVTLAQSQNYTISAAGYGKVINFDPSIGNYYDEMDGVTYKIS